MTKSLLKRDFGIEIELPDDRLCPPVCGMSFGWGTFAEGGLRCQTGASAPRFDGGRPLLTEEMQKRLSYIFWIQDLLDTTVDDFSDLYDPDREVVGLDMYAG